MANSNPKTDEATGRFAYDGLERLIHEKARLSILTSLVTNPQGLLFNDLKELCSLTDGNLSRHLQVLHEARLVEVWKGVQNGRPQTLCRRGAAPPARLHRRAGKHRGRRAAGQQGRARRRRHVFRRLLPGLRPCGPVFYLAGYFVGQSFSILSCVRRLRDARCCG
jgi:DNA-binding transcriptional ArsR family regulator